MVAITFTRARAALFMVTAAREATATLKTMKRRTEVGVGTVSTPPARTGGAVKMKTKHTVTTTAVVAAAMATIEGPQDGGGGVAAGTARRKGRVVATITYTSKKQKVDTTPGILTAVRR